MSYLTFLNPWWLLLLSIVPVIYILYCDYLKKKKIAALKFSSIGLIKKAQGEKKISIRKHISFILLVAALIFMIVAFSNPHIPLKQTKEGVNVVLVIDDSGSMQANDYKPTRLEAAKSSAEILIKSLNPKDNAGIVVFESGASTACFLTPFKDRALMKLKAISAKQGQTAIGDGLGLAVDMASSIPNKKKIVILLSDGVNNAGVMSPDEAIQFAKQNKLQVYTIAMGSEGKVILGYDWFGNPQYAELDEATLQKIASETGGKYFKSVNEKTLDQIYETISKDIKREEEPASIQLWFFAAAFILLIVDLYLRYGKLKIITGE